MRTMRYQPQGRLQIARREEIVRDLRLASLPGVDATLDILSGATGTATGTRRVSVPGVIACGFGSVQGRANTDRIATPLSGAFPAARSVFVRARRNGNGGVNVGRLFDKSVNTSGQMGYWEANTSSLAYHFFINNQERIIRAPAAQLAAVGREFDVLFVHSIDGNVSTINIYVNGVLLTSQQSTGVITDAPTTALSIGNRWDGVRHWDGSITAVMVWDRAISAAGARALSLNPWQVFADSSNRGNEYISPSRPPAFRFLYASAAGGYTETPPAAGARPLVLLNGVVREISAGGSGDPLILDGAVVRAIRNPN